MKLRWTAPALRDLEALGDYIARENPAAAAKAIAQILEHADMLAFHPHAGRVGRVSGTRELVISGTPFIVPYRVRDEDLELLAVFHGARQWPENFK
jgi:toxin ParE1/3/4